MIEGLAELLGGKTVKPIVPPDACFTELPQSSIAFCSGCEGGTQCESLSSKVLSWRCAMPEPMVRGERGRANVSRMAAFHQAPPKSVRFVFGLHCAAVFSMPNIQPHVVGVVKADSLATKLLGEL